MIFGAAKCQVDVKEGGGGSDLNIQLTLSGGKVNMSTAPNRFSSYCDWLDCRIPSLPNI